MTTPTAFPEAPVSITAHIRVPYLSKDALLVTGRGVTAGEAVANLHAAIAAVQRPAPLCAPRQPWEVSLGAIIVDAMKSVSTDEDAHCIAETAAYVIHGNIGWHHSVTGACAVQDLAPYDAVVEIVTERTCTCEIWACRKNLDFICPHMLAVQWWKQLNATKDDA